MEEERQLGSKRIETSQEATVSELATVGEVAGYISYADQVLGVDWGAGGVPQEYTPEYIISHPHETKILVIRDPNGQIRAGGKVGILNNDTRERLGLNGPQFDGKTGALLEYQVVREDSRRQGLGQLLTEKRIQWAKEHGAEYVATEIEFTNPISAHSKTKDGFIFIAANKPDPASGVHNPYLVAVRFLSGSSNPPWMSSVAAPDSFEQMEIAITSDLQDRLEKLFQDGWIGIDAKLSGSDGQMILVLRRAKGQ